MKIRLLAAGLTFVLTTSMGAQTRTPESLAQDLQRKYDRVMDFSADFVHSYRGGVLKQHATERGTLLVKKPGKMRWEYTAPEKKLFVSDGHKIYSYIPEDRQVVVGTMPRDDQAPTPALFLTGKGNLTRDFNAAFDKVADAPAGSLALKLTPKRREPEYESLTLVVDPKTLGLQMLITVDTQGGRSAFTFSNLKENVGVADNQFVFKMPRNVDVVTDGGR
ncbi:MAG TPA: outer membrane lipoprotein chaperone LolA [Vicinamibacterales bacterium]|nr:outer membrane lipoprotein chaperone LolA [Vicinamibacterales bacterium]